MKFKLKLLAALILGTLSLPGHSRVYEYTIKDIYGVEKSVSADSAKLNTTEKIQLSLISGLDRKIRVTVKKGDANVYSTTTESVKVADRIKSSSDEEFYGKVITMPPLSEGLYTITSEILNTQDALIDSTTQSFLIDTSGPTADNMRIDQRPGYDMVLTGNLWELGLGAEAKLYVTVKNVKATAGFDKATIQILNPDNTVYSKMDMVYDSGSASLSVPWTKGSAVKADWMPVSNADTEYRFRVTLYDKAGTRKVLPDQKFLFDSDLGEYTLVAVYDPTAETSVIPGFSKGYVEYKSGMTVNLNPITFVYRVPSTNRREYRKGGLAFGNIISEANGYSYVSVTTPYQTLSVIHNGYQWGGASVTYNIKMGADAPVSPTTPDVWITSDKKSSVSSYDFLWKTSDLPVTFLTARVKASARNYIQKAMSNTGGFLCNIPVGELECKGKIVGNIQKNGNGHMGFFFKMTNSDGTLFSQYAERRQYWNADQLPRITGFDYQEDKKKVLLFVNLPGNGSLRYKLQLKSAVLINADSNVQVLTGTNTAIAGDDYTYTFDLGALPEGKYNLSFLAKDTFDNESSSPFITLVNDMTPPDVIFNYENAPLASGSTVYGLENIAISLNDALTKPVLERLELKGGPASDSVILGFNQNADGSYTPDYPRLFPTLVENTDKYTLTAYATDTKGNATQKSIQFAYYPKNLVTLEKLKTLGVVKALKTSDNTPLAVMRTGQLRRNDGSLVQGVQTANITLRTDANYAINILGTVIQPGETKNIQIDLGAGVNTTVPIFPATNGATGQSDFIIEFPQIK
ncbi:TPA: Ig-like domain repeat protein [Klebsiella pneumoniae]|uniref:Ig-like domain-containing protein n=1 Tax=Klebsiella pneumoniae TaxID=573 RepID=UPI0038904C10|nr:Ig-like domain repeat protein [Klebsiella pneumoniae]HCC7662152.1 Ig-like domain repeat protein [Klebsiella pneumoniae]HCC8121527.1 Ig-like domain repeat protein [Klebsiella pneumoniae]